MTVISYQSKLVLRILKAGETYRAKPNLTLRGEYNAMIDLLGLHCECPIFGVLKGKKQNTGGKVSGTKRPPPAESPCTIALAPVTFSPPRVLIKFIVVLLKTKVKIKVKGRARKNCAPLK